MSSAVQDEVSEAVARSGPRRTVVVTVLAALVALALGLLAGVLLGRPDRPGDGSPEAGFARDMSAHHAQAVEMALIEWDGTDHAELKSMSLDIVTSQQGQIGQMQAWLDGWGLSPSGDAAPMAWSAGGHGAGHGDGPHAMRGMATREQVGQLRGATGRARDILFTELMIEHHRGGVEMAELVLARSEHRQVRQLAQGIVATQQKEIDTLQRVRTELGAAA